MKAHDVRQLRPCAGACRSFGDRRNLVEVDGRHWHGRCYVENFGLDALLALPIEQTAGLTFDDVGAAVMSRLVSRLAAATTKRGKAKPMPSHPNRSKTARFAKANPTPSEIITARKAAGDTQEQAAARIYATIRTWQDWENEGAENRRMHPGLYELYLLKAGLKTLKEILDDQEARP